MNTHIQTMWHIFSATDVPAQPSAHNLNTFNRRFATADEWEAFAKTIVYDHANALTRITAMRTALTTSRHTGSIVSNILTLDKGALHIIFSAVASAGFPEWRPDVIGQAPDSLYNIAHEHIALQTFQSVLINHGYAGLNVDLTRARDTPFLRKLYRNYVYSAVHKKVLSEAREAGSVAARGKRTTDYKRRQSVCFSTFLRSLTHDHCIIAWRKSASSNSRRRMANDCCKIGKGIILPQRR